MLSLWTYRHTYNFPKASLSSCLLQIGRDKLHQPEAVQPATISPLGVRGWMKRESNLRLLWVTCWQTNSSFCFCTAVSTAWRPASKPSRRTTLYAHMHQNCLETGTLDGRGFSKRCPSCEYNQHVTTLFLLGFSVHFKRKVIVTELITVYSQTLSSFVSLNPNYIEN
jgi:hypothetical protein